jgi:hypothetical protein
MLNFMLRGGTVVISICCCMLLLGACTLTDQQNRMLVEFQRTDAAGTTEQIALRADGSATLYTDTGTYTFRVNMDTMQQITSALADTAWSSLASGETSGIAEVEGMLYEIKHGNNVLTLAEGQVPESLQPAVSEFNRLINEHQQ